MVAHGRIEAIDAMLQPLVHLVEAKGIEEMTVRFVHGNLRDVDADGKFYTRIDGKWFRLDKVGRQR